jgi:hypothetical protein
MSRLARIAGMTGSRPQHLLRRNGTYYLRVRVPTDLQALVGLSEVRQTLVVHVLSKAKPIALKLASRVLETSDVLHQKEYSKDEASPSSHPAVRAFRSVDLLMTPQRGCDDADLQQIYAIVL